MSKAPSIYISLPFSGWTFRGNKLHFYLSPNVLGEVQMFMIYRKLAKAAWDLVCLPKAEGGLGVLNLPTQNEALLLKKSP